MEMEIGTVLTGKVTGITKFGAFVSLPENRSGMVHISEVAHVYVNDIRDHLTEGQEVTVKVLAADRSGRINLSIKKTQEAPPPVRHERAPQYASAPRRGSQPSGPLTFEDKLKAFMSDSESKMSDLKQHSDKRGSRRR